MKKNYMLGIYLMTILQKDNLPKEGVPYSGVLTVTGENEAKFEERAKCMSEGKRNFPFYSGNYVNGTIRPEDLHIRLNFKEFNFRPDLNFDAFAIEVMMEVREALEKANCLVKEMGTTE